MANLAASQLGSARNCCQRLVLWQNMACMDLDATDHAILRHLQDNGRITNAELATRVSLSPSACLRRVRSLEQAGAHSIPPQARMQRKRTKPDDIFPLLEARFFFPAGCIFKVSAGFSLLRAGTNIVPVNAAWKLASTFKGRKTSRTSQNPGHNQMNILVPRAGILLRVGKRRMRKRLHTRRAAFNPSTQEVSKR